MTVFVITCLVNSTYGRGFIAVHDDEVAAAAMGINPTRYKVTAFVVGAFFAGIAGGLYAHHKQFLSPTGFDFMKSIDIVVMVILGGMGRTTGVIIAAILLTLLPEFLRGFAEYRMIIYALLIIVLMIARPQGLFSFGKKSSATVAAQSRKSDHPLRRPDGGVGTGLEHRRQRTRRPHRPERRGQDDRVQFDHRRLSADGGENHL